MGASCGCGRKAESLPQVSSKVLEPERENGLARRHLPKLHEGDVVRSASSGRSYAIQQALGAGACGVVWLCWRRDRARGRQTVGARNTVAVKLAPGQQEKNITNEARVATKAAEHAAGYVPQVYEFSVAIIEGALPGKKYFMKVEQWINGLCMGQVARVVPPDMSRDQICTIFLKDVATALGRLHAAGLGHRDIKPDNVILSADSGTCYLIDFGLSTFLPEPGRQGGLPARGTPFYMAPEVVTRQGFVCKSDVWALGISTIEIFVGMTPLATSMSERTNVQHVVQKIREKPAPDVRLYGLPGVMSSVINGTLQRDYMCRLSAKQVANQICSKVRPGDRKSLACWATQFARAVKT